MNSGLHDTATTGKLTDLTTDTNTGNTASPVVSSASYNFVAADVNSWLDIPAGTNWLHGKYLIVSVASNKATLSAAIGAAVLANGTLNTAVGCASVGTPTAGTFSVDYSQVAAAVFSLTGLTTAAANAIILTANATKAMVGNGILITGGTNFTTGLYVVQACTAGVSLTVDRNCTTAAGAAGTAGIGGALASHTNAATLISTVVGFRVWMKTGSYNAAASTTFAGQTRVFGYSSIRGDGTMTNGPTVTATAGSLNLFGVTNGHTGVTFAFLKVNGGGQATIVGFFLRNSSFTETRNHAYKCTATSCTTGFSGVTGVLVAALFCYADSCTTGFTRLDCFGCESKGTSGSTGFTTTATGSFVFCIASGGSLPFNMQSGGQSVLVNCTAYGGTSHGVQADYPGNNSNIVLINCIMYGNGGYGLTVSGSESTEKVVNCAFGSNTSGDISGANPKLIHVYGKITLTADPFTNAAAGDFSLNTTAGGGALLRQTGIPGAFPGGLTTGYIDVGAAQAQAGGAILARIQTGM